MNSDKITEHFGNISRAKSGLWHTYRKDLCTWYKCSNIIRSSEEAMNSALNDYFDVIIAWLYSKFVIFPHHKPSILAAYIKLLPKFKICLMLYIDFTPIWLPIAKVFHLVSRGCIWASVPNRLVTSFSLTLLEYWINQRQIRYKVSGFVRTFPEKNI